jgi:hypothetical protein
LVRQDLRDSQDRFRFPGKNHVHRRDAENAERFTKSNPLSLCGEWIFDPSDPIDSMDSMNSTESFHRPDLLAMQHLDFPGVS